MSLPHLVRLVRGETTADPRPNKALNPRTYRALLQGYEQQSLMIRIAREGFRAKWVQPRGSSRPFHPNHRSATAQAASVTSSILEGEASRTYLLVDERLLPLWSVWVSPFGAVPKTDGGIRLIHDLSFPMGDSVNDHTVQTSLPITHYESVIALARRIELLHLIYPNRRILMLKGDVKGAFRHMRQHADDVVWMGGRVPELKAGVIDLSAPFGWTGSPAIYGVFGRAISTIVRRESPASMAPDVSDVSPFFAYEWVDDHVLVEPDLGARCSIAEDTLRLAMLAVLGPLAINEAKFSAWGTQMRALGLDWDCTARTVSIPADKITKALIRVEAASTSSRVPSVELQRLLGSLRHVASCLRAAKPFYQRLHAVAASVPRYGSAAITMWARDDLHWFSTILRHGHLSGVPTYLFGSLPQPDVHLYMDASDEGLCVLDPAEKRYIIVTFDDDERAEPRFDINVREQLAVALACLIFGQSWHTAYAPLWPHVRCWSDNQTTVSRTNKLSARHEFAQELNRAVGLSEAIWRLRVSTAHLPGTWNVIADAGSRLQSASHRSRFTNAVASWMQVPVPGHLRRIYATFSSTYRPLHWPQARDDCTTAPGSNGAGGVPNTVNQADYPATWTRSPSNLRYSPYPAGSATPPPSPTRRPPYCPSVATSHGIIRSDSDTRSGSPTPTALLCSGCGGCRGLRPAEPQSPSRISARSTAASTSAGPTTAFCGGLRSWATSSF